MRETILHNLQSAKHIELALQMANKTWFILCKLFLYSVSQWVTSRDYMSLYHAVCFIVVFFEILSSFFVLRTLLPKTHIVIILHINLLLVLFNSVFLLYFLENSLFLHLLTVTSCKQSALSHVSAEEVRSIFNIKICVLYYM